jgi:hypothetical protein
MTAKQAIKVRCRDCLAGARECAFTDCALRGTSGVGEGYRRGQIRRYCQWCMNGNPTNQCAKPDCAIYQYRSHCKGSLNVRFLPSKPLIVGNGGGSKLKTVKSYGKEAGDDNQRTV